jgi:hypothetical protein
VFCFWFNALDLVKYEALSEIPRGTGCPLQAAFTLGAIAVAFYATYLNEL